MTVDEVRRKNMQAVKSKDTKLELTLRKALWARGLRYRKNYGKLTGKPDIVFLKKKVAVFCDSNFWHGKDWDNRKKDLKKNREFWIKKITRNMERDKEVNKALEEQGWTVLRFWEKEIYKNTEDCVTEIEKTLRRKDKKKE